MATQIVQDTQSTPLISPIEVSEIVETQNVKYNALLLASQELEKKAEELEKKISKNNETETEKALFLDQIEKKFLDVSLRWLDRNIDIERMLQFRFESKMSQLRKSGSPVIPAAFLNADGSVKDKEWQEEMNKRDVGMKTPPKNEGEILVLPEPIKKKTRGRKIDFNADEKLADEIVTEIQKEPELSSNLKKRKLSSSSNVLNK